MEPLSFSGVVVVGLVAFLVPLVLGFMPWLRLPAVVIEISAGIIIGPAVLGLVTIDAPIHVFELVGVVFVLFLAGQQVAFAQLRGAPLRVAGLGFTLALVLALLAGLGLAAAGLVNSPILIAIALAATALGIILGIIKDAGHGATPFGQVVIAAGSLGDFGTIILLSLFFSRREAGPLLQVLLITSLAALACIAILALVRVGRLPRIAAVLQRLQDTSAQIRVRGALLLLLIFVALAEGLGLEVVLGAFVAGVVMRLIRREADQPHDHFRLKLEGIGYGVFAPFFFIASGIRFDLPALLASTASLALIPLFLGAMLVIHGLPALLLYRRLLGWRRTLAAGLFQSTSLGLLVIIAQIGRESGTIAPAVGAALVAAGLLSVLIFPLGALILLRQSDHAEPASAPAEAAGLG